MADRLRRFTARWNRPDAARARADTGDQAAERRARTRRLVEPGGLVRKAGLAGLANGGRATILGAFPEAARRLAGAGRGPPPRAAGVS